MYGLSIPALIFLLSCTSDATNTGVSRNGEKHLENASKITSKSDLLCVQEGIFRNPKNCQNYYKCISLSGYGKPFGLYEYECENGLVFDDTINCCNLPEISPPCDESLSHRHNEKECKEHHHTGSTEPPSPLPPKSPSSDENEIQEDISCQTEGFFRYPDKCNKFYRCISFNDSDTQIYHFTCPDGLFFDETINVCNWPQNVTCEDDTSSSQLFNRGVIRSQRISRALGRYASSLSARSNSPCSRQGFFRNPNNCQLFYRCVDLTNSGTYTLYEFTCPSGLVFDEALETCNWPDQAAPCETRNQEEGATSPPGTDENNSRRQHAAASETGKADDLSSSEDNSLNSGGNSDTGTTRPGSESEENEIECTKAGFFRHPEDCNRFYRCVDFEGSGKQFVRYDFNCPEGLVFDEINQVCNWPTLSPACKARGGSGGNGGTESSDGKSSTTPVSTSISDKSTVTESGSEPSSTTTSTSLTTQTTGVTGSSTSGETTEVTSELPSSSTLTSTSTTRGPTEGATSPGSTADNKETSVTESSEGGEASAEEEEIECTKAGFFRNPNDCNKFYRCVDFSGTGQQFVRYDFSCPEGLVFDEINSVCNWPTLSPACRKRETKKPTTTTTASSSSTPPPSTQEPSTSPSTVSTTVVTTDTAETTVTAENSSTTITAENSSTTVDSASTQPTTESSTAVTTASSGTTETSTSSTNTSTENECTQEGFFRDQADCNKYYRCALENDTLQRFDFTCPSGEVFDEQLGACSPPELATPCNSTAVLPGTSSPEPSTESSVDITGSTNASVDECSRTGYFRNPENCNKYYLCEEANGTFTRTDSECPEGEVFDEQLSACSPPELTTPCNNATTTPTTDISSTSTGSSTEISSEGTTESTSRTNECTQEGYYRDIEDCNKYYRCVEIDGTWVRSDFTCPEGLIFDQELAACSPPELTEPCDNLTNTTTTSAPTSPSATTDSTFSSSVETNGTSETESTTPTTIASTQSTTITSTQSTTTQGSSTSTESSSSSSSPESTTEDSSSTEIECTKAGFFTNPNDCNKFYRCVDFSGTGEQFVRYDFACPEGLVFDELNSVCNWPTISPNPCKKKSTSKPGSGTTSPDRSGTVATPSVTDDNLGASTTSGGDNSTISTESSSTEMTTEGIDNSTTGGPTSTSTGSTSSSSISSGGTETERPSTDGTSSTTSEGGSSTDASTTVSSTSTERSSTDGSTSGATEATTTSRDISSTTPSGTTETTTSSGMSSTTPSGTSETTTLSGVSSTTPSGTSETTSSGMSSTTPSETTETTSSGMSSTTPSGTTEASTTSSTTSQATSTTITSESSSSSGATSGTSEDSSSTEIECTKAGFFINPNNCNKFYRCVDFSGTGEQFVRYDFSCPEGLVFDEVNSVCNWPTISPNPCKKKSTPKPGRGTTTSNDSQASTGSGTNGSSTGTTSQLTTSSATDVSGGSTTDLTSTTTMSSTTVRSEESTTVSSTGLPTSESSEPPRRTDSDTTPGSTTENTSSPSASSSVTTSDTSEASGNRGATDSTSGESGTTEIECTKAGFFINPNNCNKFYRCVDFSGTGEQFVRYDFSCPEGLVFDEVNSVCNWPTISPNPCKKKSKPKPSSGTTTSSSSTDSGSNSSTTGSSSEVTTSDASGGNRTEPISTLGGSSTTVGSESTTTGSSSEPPTSTTDGSTTSGMDGSSTVSTSSETPTPTQVSSTSPSVSSESTTSAGGSTSDNSGATRSTSEESSSTEIECTKAGFFINPNNCNKFYRCVDFSGTGEQFVRYDFSCPEGLVFDEVNSVCNWPTISPNPCKKKSKPKPEGGTTSSSGSGTSTDSGNNGSSTDASTGNTSDLTSTTTISSTTVRSEESTTVSSTGLPTSESSEPPRRTDSDTTSGSTAESTSSATTQISSTSSVSSSVTTGVTTSDTSDTSGNRGATDSTSGESGTTEIECTKAGFFINPNNCNKFYRCVDFSGTGEQFVRYDFSCPEGLVFDEVNSVCNWPTISPNPCKKKSKPSETTISSGSTDSGSSRVTTSEASGGNRTEPVSMPAGASTTVGSESTTGSSSEPPTSTTDGSTTSGMDGSSTVSTSSETPTPTQVSSTSPSVSSESTSPGGSTSDNSGATRSTSEDSSSTEIECTKAGFFINPNNCNKFYRCVDFSGTGEQFVRYDFSCPEGLVFDEVNSVCNWPTISPNPCKKKSTSGPGNETTTSDGSGASTDSGNTGSSTSSITEVSTSRTTDISGGNATEPVTDISTSVGTTSGSVDSTTEVNISSTLSSNSLESTTSNSGSVSGNENTTDGSSGTEIECTKAGFFVNPNDCNKFYRCVDFSGTGEQFVRYDFSCPEGLVFDEVNSVCNWPTISPSPCKKGSSGGSGNRTTTTSDGSEISSTLGVTDANETSVASPTTTVSSSEGSTTDIRNGTNDDNFASSTTEVSTSQLDGSTTGSLETSLTTDIRSTTDSGVSSSTLNENSTSEATSISSSSIELECPRAGFFVNPNDCNQFYRCVDFSGTGEQFVRYDFACPEGLVFDEINTVCNWPTINPSPCRPGSGRNTTATDSTTITTTVSQTTSSTPNTEAPNLPTPAK